VSDEQEKKNKRVCRLCLEKNVLLILVKHLHRCLGRTIETGLDLNYCSKRILLFVMFFFSCLDVDVNITTINTCRSTIAFKLTRNKREKKTRTVANLLMDFLSDQSFNSSSNNNNIENQGNMRWTTNNENERYNRLHSTTTCPKYDRLRKLLRQSNQLLELKFNRLENHSSSNSSRTCRQTISTSEHGKNSCSSSIYLRYLHLPLSLIDSLQTDITDWLRTSQHLVNSICTLSIHRHCWSQLLLTYFIEHRRTNLEFIRCTYSSALSLMNSDSCAHHLHACLPEDDAHKLLSVLRKGTRFNIDSIVFDHMRRIIVLKSMQECKYQYLSI
jgi:hypothetical protein